MNLQALKEWVKRRLNRKARQAERAYVSEFTVKCTTNCLNHGIQLGENIWHCRINALGLHEKGASQCWNQKARICPLFELLRDVETLRSDFRKMQPNELAIRWPSLGELLRFDYMLSLIDGPEKYEETLESSVYKSGDELQSSEDEERVGPSGRDVQLQYVPGHSHSTSAKQASIDASRESDSGGSELGTGHEERLSLAPVDRSGDGDHSDREKVRSG
jgi:hypothetical protein